METVTETDGVRPAELEGLESTVRAALPDYLAELERMVNTDCGSYTKAGVDAVGARAAALFEELGATVERRPNDTLGDTIVATFEGTERRGPRVLLIGHLDTVFDPGTAAERSFRVEDGRAFGPGVTDMKSGLLAGVHAIAALRTLEGSKGLPFE